MRLVKKRRPKDFVEQSIVPAFDLFTERDVAT